MIAIYDGSAFPKRNTQLIKFMLSIFRPKVKIFVQLNDDVRLLMIPTSELTEDRILQGITSKFDILRDGISKLDTCIDGIYVRLDSDTLELMVMESQPRIKITLTR